MRGRVTWKRTGRAAGPIRIVKGFDVPIGGEPEQVISGVRETATVALLGGDYRGVHPAMRVEVGDRVKLGQPLFADRRQPKIVFTSPGGGIVKEINRGARRALLSVVVEFAGDEQEMFVSWPATELPDLRLDQVIDTLLSSGLWTALRARPFGKVPDPTTRPSSLFVTAVDSNPLSANPEVIIASNEEDFRNGLTVVSHLTDDQLYLCQAPRAGLPTGAADRVVPVEFSGPHPSGLVGTHIHYLDPVGASKTVWHLGYQDVIAIGRLFTTGRIVTERVVALAGPGVTRPRLIRTRLGANIADLAREEVQDADGRVISGSPLSGRHAKGALGYLGRYHTQVSVIAEGGDEPRASRFVPWRGAGYSAYGFAVARSSKNRTPVRTTALNGAATAFVPLGSFERVMPLDILPTQLLRALLVGDIDMARGLGCLELDEEDLALCTFVCPSKINYGLLLGACLDQIEKGA